MDSRFSIGIAVSAGQGYGKHQGSGTPNEDSADSFTLAWLYAAGPTQRIKPYPTIPYPPVG